MRRVPSPSPSTRPLVGRRGVSAGLPTGMDRERAGAERVAREELDAWRRRAIPDSSTPLEVEDLVRLLGDCIASLGLDRAIVAGVTTNTVHYYRRKDIIDPPEGRTVAARWSARHLWQVAGARLAGHLGLVTLAQARDVIRGADTGTLLAFLAARVVDARARDAVRKAGGYGAGATSGARPLSRRTDIAPPGAESHAATAITLPGDVLCVVPASHPAHRSADHARELGRALTKALLDRRSRMP